VALIRPIQTAFSAGEVSSHVAARTDIEKYKTACKKLRNFIVHPTGAASNRPGLRFVAEAKYATMSCVVQEFIFNQDQAYILEIGNEYIRFYTNGAQVEVNPDLIASWSGATAYVVGDYVTYGASTVYYAIQDGTNQQPDTQTAYWTPQTIYEIPAPWLEEDLSLLRFESSADTIFITHPDYQQRVLQRFGATDWRIDLYAPADGPFMPENTDEGISLSVSAVTGSITLSAASAVFADGHEGGLFKLRHYIEGQAASQAFSSATTGTGIKCFTTWRVISHGTWTGKFNIEKSDDGGTTWTVLRTFSSTNDFNANTSGTEDIENNPEPFLVRVNMYSYSSGTANIDLTTDAFYQDGIVEVTTINSSTSAGAIVLQEVGSTAQTISWSEGSWSDYRGWPGVAKFYQDRLCFGGTYSEPMTVWCSVTSEYFSFMRHSTLLDTDSISTNLPSRQLNAINGMVALTKLIVLTSAMEWSVGPGSNGVFSANGFEVKPEGYRGSSGVVPVVVGNEIIYVQPNSKTLRTLGFELASDSFTGGDMNILARHLFDNYTILDMAYQQDPDSIVWILRNDGRMAAMTYMKEQEVVAFHWHDTGAADDVSRDLIESIAVIPNKTDNFDEVWVAVNRLNGIMIERMALRLQSNNCAGDEEVLLEDQVHLDSSVQYSEQSSVTTITIGTDDVFTITSPAHGFSNGDLVRLRNVAGYPSLSNRQWIIGNVTTDTFDLITEVV
jgi:hypothetical protein